MTTNEELEALYGPPATHAEYKVGQIIRYHRTTGDIHTGEILYVVAPHPVLMRDGRTVNAPLSYVIAPDDVIYQLKNTVSQITCHAAKRVQRIGFSHNLAWHRTSFFFRSPLLSFVRSCNILARLHEKCAEKCLKMVAFLTPLRYTCYGSEKETRDFSTIQGKTMAGPIPKRALNR